MVDISQLGVEIKQAYEGNVTSEGKSALAKNKVAGLQAGFDSLNLQEQMSWSMSSGMMGLRQYSANQAFNPEVRAFHDPYSANNAHDHWNFRSMPGLSEIVTFIGGRYIQWRHQDYTLRKSVIHATATTNGTEYVHAPDVPTSVLSKPTGVSGATLDFVGDTQAKYMKEQYTTNKADVEMALSYCQVWWQVVGGAVPDEGDSPRHAELAGDMETAYREMAFNRASGQKDRFENRSVAPVEVIGIDDDGQAVYGIAHTQIMVKKIGNMGDVVAGNLSAPRINVAVADSHGHELDAQMTDQQAQDLVDSTIASLALTSSDGGHPHTYTITWNGSDFVGVCSESGHVHDTLVENDVLKNFPFDADKAAKGTLDSTNQFALVDDSRLINMRGSKDSVVTSRQARFTLQKGALDRIMETLPGLDGEGAFLEEHSPTFVPSLILDRDGETLNAAYYNRTHKYQINDAGGRTNADRGFNDPNFYTASTANPDVFNGRSYALPLEIVALAPLDNWNPYGIDEVDRTVLQAEKAGGAGSASGNPFTGRSDKEFHYLTPFGLFSDSGNDDPADTGKTAWVEDSGGTARKMYGTGISQFTPDGVQRRRFPVYPVAQEFSYESVQTLNLKALLKDVLKGIRAGTVTDADIDDAF